MPHSIRNCCPLAPVYVVASDPGQARGVAVDDALVVEEPLDTDVELPDTVELPLVTEVADEDDAEDEETVPPVASFAPQMAGALVAPPRVFLR